jgi:hypothetical protein
MYTFTLFTWWEHPPPHKACLPNSPYSGEQIEDGVFRKLKGCSVLSSTDDLSVLKKLSLGSTAVAAELRDPVERLVEAYELAVEIALQKLDADRAKSPFEAMQKQHPNDVWPWSKFTPFLAKDLAQRVRRFAAGRAGLLCGILRRSCTCAVCSCMQSPAS